MNEQGKNEDGIRTSKGRQKLVVRKGPKLRDDAFNGKRDIAILRDYLMNKASRTHKYMEV